jgi:hypothetical protein
MKVFWRYNRKLHMILGFFLLMMTLILGLKAMERANWTFFNGKHSTYGFWVLSILLLTVGFGYFTLIML